MPFKFGRMLLDSPEQWTEQMGDPVTNIGGAPVPAVRTALRHSVDVPTFTSPIATDTPERRFRLRRQIRSLLNNTNYKMLGIFLIWEDDEEQNGWYIPDQGQLAAGADSPLTHGYFKLENFVWFKSGAPRTHRAAAGLSVKALSGGLWPRDILRTIYSTDFSALGLTGVSRSIVYLRPNITDVVNAVNLETQEVQVTLPTGRDGGANTVLIEQPDLTVISYEVPETSMTLGDVIVYDQRGLTGLPSKAEDPQTFGWEEIYGPDYEYTPNSVPVLDNGLIRVIYDPTHIPGFKVYVWSGTEYVEQGKMLFKVEGGDSSNIFAETFVSATIKEYTPERGVVQVVLTAKSTLTGDTNTWRCTVYITLQRGWRGPRFEMYSTPAKTFLGESSVAEGSLYWSPPAIPANTSAIKFDGTGAKIKATAGSGSKELPTGLIGDSTFSNENLVVQITEGGNYQVAFAVVRANIAASVAAVTEGYGVVTNNLIFKSNEAGYISAQLGFITQQTDQIMEAENMILGSGTTVVTDSEASGGKTTQASRTTMAVHVSRATWPNGHEGRYRVLARAKVALGATLSLRATAALPGSIVTTSSATYAWVDLGDIFSGAETLNIEAATTGITAFPTITVNDTLKRAAEKPLSNGGKWSVVTGAKDTGAIVAGEYWSPDLSEESGARWNVGEQANQAVSLEVVAPPAENSRWIGLWACLSAAAKSGYLIRWRYAPSTTTYEIEFEKYVAGVETLLAHVELAKIEAGDSIGVTVAGGVIRAWRKHAGVWSPYPEASTSDATFTKGYGGMAGVGTLGHYRNFSIGEVPTTFDVDRIEAVLTEDTRFAAGGTFGGARDLAYACLYDSRATPTVVTRT
jgi:hypothetical protein